MGKLDGEELGDGDGVGSGCWTDMEGRESLEVLVGGCTEGWRGSYRPEDFE